MADTVNLSKSQIETIAMAAYQEALKDISNRGYLQDGVVLNKMMKDAMEEAVRFVGETSFQRYRAAQRDSKK